MNKDARVALNNNPSGMCVDLYISFPSKQNPNQTDYVTNFTVETQDIDAYPVAPSMQLSREACQQICDEVYRLGFRPSIDQYNDKAILAISNHLDDMRSIAFHKLNIGDKL